MLMRKTLACLLIPTLLTIANTSKANALSTGEVEENKVINYNDTNDDLTLMNMYLNYELEWQRDNLMAKVHRVIKAKELIVQKVNERIDSQIKRLEEQEQKRIEEKKEKLKYQRNFIVTYYGATYNECGNSHFITASGIPVQEGHIAVPRSIPFGSKIILDGVEYVATDTGNPKYICELSDGTLRVDVFVGRQSGESDYQYEKRVNNMGVRKITGELYINQL